VGIDLGAITSTVVCVGGTISAGEANRARDVERRWCGICAARARDPLSLQVVEDDAEAAGMRNACGGDRVCPKQAGQLASPMPE